MVLPPETEGFLGNWMTLTPGLRAMGFPGGAEAPARIGLTETTDFGDNPGNLRMLSYVPEGLPPGAPLVVVLHGCTQSAGEYRSRFRLVDARGGFRLRLAAAGAAAGE